MPVDARTALVTGGTDGIGKEVARGLVASGYRVVVVGRDEAKGRAAVASLREGGGVVEYLRADLTLLREAERLGDELAARFPALSRLVHGAGFVRGRRVVTDEGLESNFAVNYVARFALTQRLLPSLAAAARPGAHARIVLLGGAARGGRIRFDDPQQEHGFGVLRTVAQFCEANDVFTVALAHRLAASATPVSIACLKIGVVKTGIRGEFPPWMKLLVPILFDPFLAQTPEAVAARALELLLSPEHEGESGALYSLIRRFVRLEPDAATRDAEVAARLWELSETLVRSARRYSAGPQTPVSGSQM